MRIPSHGGILAFFALALSSVWAQNNPYVLRAARLFDGKSDGLVQPGEVVVADGKIQSIGGPAPAKATVIDLGDATLLPGFIDAHTHLTQGFDADYQGARLRGMERTIPEEAIRATVNARKTLMAGFTTVRDVGSSDFLDIGLRNSINSGVFQDRACWSRCMLSALPEAIAMRVPAFALAY
jgi:imidazolonepropionase-like amidohydrolase